uniref:Translin n=1 Tax=Cyclophora tenuis TaxID=216820 RepID=A0A7S1D4M2_CYCTE
MVRENLGRHLSSCLRSLQMQPQKPLQYLPPGATKLELSAFGAQLAETERKKQKVYEASRRLQIELIKAKSGLECGEPVTGVETLLFNLVPVEASRQPREANLSFRLEDYVRVQSYSFFLEQGKLLPPSACKYATDEEYLAGALMGLCSDLARYGMGQATGRDVVSVKIARDLVHAIQNELLQFDFRNGPLRRKFDGTKYSLKTLETLLYELSVTGSAPEHPQNKKHKCDLVPTQELKQLRSRMEYRDELREKLIKMCRDGQKAAKQSIFALHRGDRKMAENLLQQCETCIDRSLLPIATEEPPLRYAGSLTGVLEEYVEAKQFHVWLFGKDGSSTEATGDLLLPDEFSVDLTPEEYLGGLCDVTGEIGRFAVQRGTVRDTDGVRLCLRTNSSIWNALQTLERVPGSIGKKMDAMRLSVEKLERILYEMSLSEATGRTVVTMAQTSDSNDKANHNSRED